MMSIKQYQADFKDLPELKRQPWNFDISQFLFKLSTSSFSEAETWGPKVNRKDGKAEEKNLRDQGGKVDQTGSKWIHVDQSDCCC